ncbi:glycosyl transferase, partial [Pectobacterium polaris]|nr:glycosyl transferase [Pectobacterium polaris]
LKTIKNRSLLNGVQSVMSLAIFSAGLIKGLTRPVRNPMTPPNSKVIHE